MSSAPTDCRQSSTTNLPTRLAHPEGELLDGGCYPAPRFRMGNKPHGQKHLAVRLRHGTCEVTLLVSAAVDRVDRGELRPVDDG